MSALPNNILEGWTVMVVEDDPVSMDVAIIVLENYGAHVFTAINGEQALDILESIRPDFIISDLSMPVLDGWGFIKAVKKDRTLAEIPVIALTAHAYSDDRKRAISEGFHNYLTKPFTVETFVSDLLQLLDNIPDFQGALLRNPKAN